MDNQIGFPRAVADEYQAIVSDSSPKNWAIFGYDKMSNDLKVIASGEDGLEELEEEWDDSKILYAFAKVVEPISKLPKLVFISWCGDGVPVQKKGLFHSHVNDATRFFKGFHVHVNARAEIDVTPDAIMRKVRDSCGAKYSIHNEQAKKSGPVESVGSSYVPVQTAPKPMSSAPPQFNRPSVGASAAPPQFNRPSAAATTTPSYAPPRASNVTSPFLKQSSFPTPAPIVSPPAPAPAPIAVPIVSNLRGICAKAVYTYEANEANEIGFTEGETVSEIEKLDEGWWQGKNAKGQVGLFPNNYVEEIQSTPAAVVSPVAAATPSSSGPTPVMFNRPMMKTTTLPAAVVPSPPSPATVPVSSRPSFGAPSSPAAVSVPSRPSFGASSPVAAASATSPSSYQPYMSSSANAWLGDDDEQPKAKSSSYGAAFARAPLSPGEDRVAAEKERREREDRELRERAEVEQRERDAREKREAEEKEERQIAAAFAASATIATPPPPPAAAAAGHVGISAHAIYQYDAQESNEISFFEGELIIEIEKSDEGWWQGKNSAGHVGLFPSTYVEEVSATTAAPFAIPPPPAPPAPVVSEQIEAIALYDYEATEPNEISFASGERITNIVFVSDDWWQGRVAGVDGLFPGNYVEVQK
ncbi:hypothetical protein HDU98_009761 [Podochytrium sp. JEL0797]|nr:hypothetical protein HDU98_009761 [Podochytrium sp. JEL0797]